MNEPLVTILDDEPQIRTMLSDALTEAGFRTAAFARATEFEAALKRQTPDVCLVDLGLPDRDGLALVHRLALESGAAIIIISGRAQVQDRVTGLELGADDYIIKPFDPAEVVARIRARLRVVPPRPEALGDRAVQRLDRPFRPLPAGLPTGPRPRCPMPRAKCCACSSKAPSA
jgi:two-component system OmpR family response regulator